jgi:uncharacterized UBP type Zn finger protein
MYRLINPILRRAWTGQVAEKPCSHLHLIQVRQTDINVCPECVALGDTWPALRRCMICGHVGCCEKSKNQHALKHYQETGHPLVMPVNERNMQWIWCYADQALLDPR